MSLSDRDRLHELLIWGGKDSSDGVMVEMFGSQPRGQEEQAVWATGLQVGKEVWAEDKCCQSAAQRQSWRPQSHRRLASEGTGTDNRKAV